MDIQTVLYPLLNDLIMFMGAVLLAFLSAYVKAHFSAKQIETTKAVANVAVGFANELDHALGIKGEEKLNSALEQAKLLAGKYGIKLTDEQWTGLIKAAVNEARIIYESVGKVEPVIVVAPVGVVEPQPVVNP